MKMYKWLLLLIPVLILSMLACRPVVRGEAPVKDTVETLPAQVVTPESTLPPAPASAPTAAAAPEPAVLPALTPAPAATPTPAPVIAATPAATPVPTPQATPTPTPTPTPSLPYTILTPMPGIDRSKPPPSTPPVQNLTQFPPAKTAEEKDAQLQQRLKELGSGPWVIQPASGPTTKGAKINVGKTLIKLPDDAYIDYRIDYIDCLAGKPCPKAPIYGIVRGKSKISFSAVDGEVGSEKIALGEIGTFDFLKDYLKRKTPSPTTAPVFSIAPPAATGPTTKGANVEIAGKSIKLPDDVYIDAFIISIYSFQGRAAPKVPYYRVVRGEPWGDSWIEFSAADGEMVAEKAALPSDIDALISLKRALNLKERTTY